MPTTPAVLCRPDGLHVAETSRLWIVSGRYSDLDRWIELASEPQAQRWLGWPAQSLAPTRLGDLADPLQARQPVLPLDWENLFFAGIHRRSGRLVAGILVERSAGSGRVGGVVNGDYRGQGYGRESLQAVCAVAHRHFGMARLTAGCQQAHVACRRWLAGAGFVATDGPPTHTLPDGRVVEAIWWERRDDGARLACRRAPKGYP